MRNWSSSGKYLQLVTGIINATDRIVHVTSTEAAQCSPLEAYVSVLHLFYTSASVYIVMLSERTEAKCFDS
jgi:hypothetical protein